MVLGIAYRDGETIGSTALQPIAIVGASCRLPGAPDLAALRSLLREGRDAVTEIPDDRWAKPLYFHPYPGQRGRSYTFAAGVLDNVYGFDAGFFGISPREAAQMDPQQRLCLELAFEAFEDAGVDSRSLAGEPVGVYVGGSSWDYQSLHNGDVASADAYSMTGATLCSLSNRVSYAFDLRGPSFTVDTACSSSLVALHLACEALRQGQIRAALVGGVNLLLAPQSFVGFSRASMLSPQGRCHAFDARANGYVRSEGGGFVLLMREDDAAAAGHRARALIRGTGTNSDGRTTGFSQPNRIAQAAMLRGIYDRFNIDPDELTYIEAHGTGTPVGDPIEAAALGEVLGTRRRESLPMGSVKTNLGHLEAASGMAGLMKALLIIDERELPRSLHCETPNPAIPLDELNLRLLPQGEAVPGTGPITIGVNSFGFGGTNAHCVLSSAPTAPFTRADQASPSMLLLSARSAAALDEQAAQWSDEIAARGDAGLPGLLAGAACFREQHAHRLAVIADDAEGYRRALADVVAGRERSTVVRGEAVGSDRLAFVYSGNGSQWAGMAANALQHSPAFRRYIGDASDALHPLLGWSVADRLAAAPDAERLRLTQEAQPQLFAIQYATTNVLRDLGVTASAQLGHSVGEIAAAWAAGALTLDDAARVVAARSRHQGGMAGEGGMAVLVATPDEVEAGIAAIGATGLAVAAINTERSLTVAGPVRELQALKDHAAAHRWTFELLDLPYAFHSPLMEPIRAPLLADLAGLVARPTQSEFVSTVTGGVLPGQRLGADYWWRNVREPVNFAGGIERLLESGARIFVEIGPQPILQGYLNKLVTAEGVRGRVLPSLVRRPMPVDPLLVCAARCHVAGHSIAAVVAGVGAGTPDGLPRYQWQREELRVERTPEATDRVNPARSHTMLGFQSSDEGREWTSDLSVARLPWLEDHTVSRTPVLPAAAFIEVALAAARTLAQPGATLELRDLDIGNPLVLPPGATQTLRSSLAADGKLTLASRQRLADAKWATHATCRVAASGRDEPLPWSGAAHAAVQRTIGADELYALTDRLGLHYGPAFQTVTSVDLLGPRDAAVHLHATVESAPNQIVHPSQLDGAFQGLVGLAASLLRLDEEAGGVLPWRFERVRSFRPGTAIGAKLHVRHVGPRAICADVLVHDADGAALLELNGCWFVRTNAAPVRDPAGQCVHEITVAAARDGVAAPASLAIDDQPPGLADVYIGAAIQEAVLAHGGELPTGQADAMTWLAEDGLLEGGRVQSELGGIRADDLIGAIAFDHPTAVADAALLSLAAQRFRACLDGADPTGPLPPALLEQMLTASPTALSGQDAMRASVLDVVAHRPGLRILEIGAGRGTLATDLLPALRDVPPADYCVLAGADELPALRETMMHLPAARSVARPSTDAALAGPFDLIVGIDALTLMAPVERETLLAKLPGLLAPGGTLLLLEPQPNRLWRFLPVPDASAQPATTRGSADWIAMLALAGLVAPTATEIPGLHWRSILLRCHGAAPAARRPVGPGRFLVLAMPGDAAADSLASHLDMRRADLADGLELAGLSGLILMPPPTLAESDAPAWLAALVRAALAASGPALPLWLVLHGEHDGSGPIDPGAAALAAACRVVANEAPTVTCRTLSVAGALDLTAAAALIAAEIAAPTGETDIVLDGSGRRVSRFRPGLPSVAECAPGTARRLVVSRPGRLDSLQFEAFTPEAPGAGQVAIDVRAAGLNFRDVMWAMGLLPDEALLHGFAGPGLGFECAGIVTAVGPGVDGFAPGDRVMAVASTCLATHAVTAAFATLKMPDGMSFADGATIPVAYLTVAYALGTLGQLRAGERVLIHGGAGAVGLAAVQYARNRGAVVFATAGSEAKRALLRSLGVDHVLDSRSLSFADDVLAATAQQGVDLVLNSLDGEAMERSLGLLKPFGRFLELGKRDVYGNTSIGLRPMRHNISYHVIDVDQLAAQRPAVAREVLDEVAGLLADGRVRPLPRREMKLAQAGEAFRLMQAAGHIGKLVLVPGDAPLPAPRGAATFAARSDAAYVVVGGLGGFGLETARWLARHGARRLALLGRRGVRTPGAPDALAAMATDGIDARAYACDAADPDALEATLAAIRRELGPIAGVVHAAMHLEDGLIASLDAARFERSLRAKWRAAELLDRMTHDDAPGLFLLFSSVTTVLGNPGQANYVAANAALEAIARRRHRAGLPALAVGWGPIADAGILTRQAGVAEELERRMGAAPMTAADALNGLPRLLQSGLPVVTFAPMDWNGAKQLLTALQAPAFAWLAQHREAAAPSVDIRAMLAGHDDAEAERLILGLLVEEMATVMRLPADRVDPARPLAEIGMDSLMAVELRLGMEARFGMSLPLFALSDTTTPLSLAGVLAGSVRGERQQDAPAPTAFEDVLRRHDAEPTDEIDRAGQAELRVAE